MIALTLSTSFELTKDVPLLTFHPEISWLNAEAERNIRYFGY